MDDITEIEDHREPKMMNKLKLSSINHEPSESFYSESEDFEESLDNFEPLEPEQGQHIESVNYTSAVAEKIREILRKDKKSHEECVFLYKKLKKFEFFTQFRANNPDLHAVDALVALCRILKLETYGPESILFRAKDQNDYKIYLVLSGIVNCCKVQEPKNFFKSKTLVFDDESSTDATPRSTVDAKSFVRRERGLKTTISPQARFKFFESKSRLSDFESACNAATETSVYDGLKIIDSIKAGGTLGSKNLDNPPQKREFTAIAGTLCELLSFRLEDYHSLVTRFEKSNTKLQNFLFDHIPELEKSVRRELFQNLENFFWEETFPIHNRITIEGNKGKTLYILYEGKCELLKEYDSRTNSIPTDRSISLPTSRICIIEPGVFIGEEILFNKTNLYEYTAKVISSEAKVLAIDKNIFKTKFPHSVLYGLHKLFLNKTQQNHTIQTKKIETIASMPSVHQALSPKARVAHLVPSHPQAPKFHSNLLAKSIYNNYLQLKENSPYGFPPSKGEAIKQFSRKNIDFIYDKDVLRASTNKPGHSASNPRILHPSKTTPKIDPSRIEYFKFDFGKNDQTKILKPLNPRDTNIASPKTREGFENEKTLSRLASYLSPERKSQLNFRVLEINQSNMKSAEASTWNDSSMMPISVSRLRMSLITFSENGEQSPLPSLGKEDECIKTDAFLTGVFESEPTSRVSSVVSLKRDFPAGKLKKAKLPTLSSHRRTKSEMNQYGLLFNPEGKLLGMKSPMVMKENIRYKMEIKNSQNK